MRIEQIKGICRSARRRQLGAAFGGDLCQFIAHRTRSGKSDTAEPHDHRPVRQGSVATAIDNN